MRLSWLSQPKWFPAPRRSWFCSSLIDCIVKPIPVGIAYSFQFTYRCILRTVVTFCLSFVVESVCLKRWLCSFSGYLPSLELPIRDVHTFLPVFNPFSLPLSTPVRLLFNTPPLSVRADTELKTNKELKKFWLIKICKKEMYPRFFIRKS